MNLIATLRYISFFRRLRDILRMYCFNPRNGKIGGIAESPATSMGLPDFLLYCFAAERCARLFHARAVGGLAVNGRNGKCAVGILGA